MLSLLGGMHPGTQDKKILLKLETNNNFMPTVERLISRIMKVITLNYRGVKYKTIIQNGNI